jgi:hypothetical protein
MLAPMIEVKCTRDGDPLTFDVTVKEDDSSSRHQVTMSRDMAVRLAGDRAPEACIEAAFRFLLDREPKESIMGRFDVTVVSRYFPEFEATLPDYLQRV